MSDAPRSYDVTGMTCGNCARHVQEAVEALPGVNAAVVDLGAGIVTVSAAGVTDAQIAAAIDEAGYQVAS